MTNRPICVDAGLLVCLVVVGPRARQAEACWVSWKEEGRRILSASLVYYEVANALRRYVVHEELDREEAEEALDISLALDVEIVGDANLHRDAFDIAGRLRLPAVYDAHYLAVAIRAEAEFFTTDRRLARKAEAAFDFIHVI